jgi:hypothetical protein
LILALAISGASLALPVVYFIGGRTGPVSTRDLWGIYFSKFPAWGTVYVMTFLARMAVAGYSPFVQLLVCVPTGLLLGGALLLPFRSFREDAFFTFTTVKKTFLMRFAQAKS